MLWQPRPIKYSCAAGIHISSSCDPSRRTVKYLRERGGRVLGNLLVEVHFLRRKAQRSRFKFKAH